MVSGEVWMAMLARYLIGDVARDTILGFGLLLQKHFGGGDEIIRDSPSVAGFITARAEKILIY